MATNCKIKEKQGYRKDQVARKWSNKLRAITGYGKVAKRRETQK